MALTLKTPKAGYCEDCGGEAIFHKMTYATIALDEFTWKIFPPSKGSNPLLKIVSAAERVMSPRFLQLTAKLGLAQRITSPDDDTQLLAKCLWEEANKRGISMWEWRLFGLPRNTFFARYPSGKVIALEGIPAATYEDDRVWWMDDKARLKEEFMKLGLPVACGGAARTAEEALSIYRSITPPIIVKPHSGSGSRHTILHIKDEDELIRAFNIAKQVSPKAIIEEELVGPVYRATVVDGKFAAALRRDPPSVLADGVHTIAELVAEENKKPGRSGPYFSKVQLFDEQGIITEKAAQELAWQGYMPQSIPDQGTRVYFHQKVNWGVGGTTVDVTDDVHPDNIQLFEEAAKALHSPVVGHDFIIKDISKSWKEQERLGILECNSMPFFDNHHLPFEGKPRNVAAAIWDMVSPKS